MNDSNPFGVPEGNAKWVGIVLAATNLSLIHHTMYPPAEALVDAKEAAAYAGLTYVTNRPQAFTARKIAQGVRYATKKGERVQTPPH